MINIIIADDHPIMRMGLVRLINSKNDISVTQQASTSEELINFMKLAHYDIVLLDLVMPEKGGIWSITQIHEFSPKTKIIILSGTEDKNIVYSAIKLGVDGFVTEAIRVVYDGERYISKNISTTLLESLQEFSDPKTKKLSKRELQTMALAGEGKSLTQIAIILELSVKTVSTYKSRIFDKLHFANNNDLIKFAINNNIQSKYFLEDV